MMYDYDQRREEYAERCFADYLVPDPIYDEEEDDDDEH